MFVKNSTVLPSTEILWVDKACKDYLEKKKFAVLSYRNNKFAFTKSPEIINAIREGRDRWINS